MPKIKIKNERGKHGCNIRGNYFIYFVSNVCISCIQCVYILDIQGLYTMICIVIFLFPRILIFYAQCSSASSSYGGLFSFPLQELLFPVIEISNRLQLLASWEDHYKSTMFLLLICWSIIRFAIMFCLTQTSFCFQIC